MAEQPRILIVDDESDITEILRLFLSDYAVRIASDGASALEVLAANSFELMITDIHIPIMSGFELIKRVESRYPGLPIIVLSGHLETMTQPASVSRWVSKPFRKTQIIEAIEAVLSS